MAADSTSLFNFVPNSHGNKEASVKETISLSPFLTTACTKSFVVCSPLCVLEGKEGESTVAHGGQGWLQVWPGGTEQRAGQAERVMTRAVGKWCHLQKKNPKQNKIVSTRPPCLFPTSAPYASALKPKAKGQLQVLVEQTSSSRGSPAEKRGQRRRGGLSEDPRVVPASLCSSANLLANP